MILLLSVLILLDMFLVYYIFQERGRAEEKIQKIKDETAGLVAFAREDALKKSRQTINGAITESLAPLIPGWPYNGRDATHVGSPLDYVVFNGMSTLRDTGEGEIEIVLIDVKTGNAQLTPIEKAIKEACEEKRIRWETLRFSEERQGLLPVKHRKKKEIVPEEEIPLDSQ